MNFLKEHPFIRIFIPFIIGISFAYSFPFSVKNSFLLFITTTLLFLVVYPIQFQYRHQFIKGLIFNLFLISLGILLTSNSVKKQVLTQNESQNLFIGRFLNIPTEKENSYKTEIELEAQQVGFEWKKQEGKLIAFFEKDTLIPKAIAGQQFVFRTQLEHKEKGTNPFGFNYQNYLKLKQVESTIFLKKEDWQLIHEPSKGVAQLALNLRKKWVDIFESAGLTGNELAVVSALTLGYKDKMEASIRDAYTAAGVVHVLAVSGAHVAIIFMALSLLLKMIPGISKIPRIKYSFLIFSLWVYAFITGLSPSVCRATTMFSFVLVGNLLKKQSNIYNSMAASAVVLLFVNPLWLFDIGFQLSYIAVIGIVYFYPKIYGWFYIKNKVADYIWSLVAVSLSAQLITTPLTLYYFHVFPTYFWLSNIVVVLGATLLTYLAALLLVTTKISVLFQGLAVLVKYLLLGMNGFVVWVTQLPKAQISQIPMNGFMMVLLFMIIFSLSSWFISKSYRSLITTLILVFLGTILHYFETTKQKNQTYICIYQIPKQTAIQFIQGKKSWWLTTQKQTNEELKKLESEANLYWGTSQNTYYHTDSSGIKIMDGPFYYQEGFWEFLNYRGILFNKSYQWPLNVKEPLKLQLAVVTGNPSYTRKEVSANYHIQHWITDGSVPIWEVSNWKLPGDTLLHQTHIDGAYIKAITPP